MTTQPEALRLADQLDLYATGDTHQSAIEQAAAELRRLHESNTDLLAAYQEALATLKLMASHAKWLNVTTDSFILKLERTTP